MFLFYLNYLSEDYFLGIHVGLGWSYPCDIWSVGCILVELCTVWIWTLLLYFLVILWNHICIYCYLLIMCALTVQLCNWFAGGGFISNPWEFGAPSNDGEGPWAPTSAYAEESRVCILSSTSSWMSLISCSLCLIILLRLGQSACWEIYQEGKIGLAWRCYLEGKY